MKPRHADVGRAGAGVNFPGHRAGASLKPATGRCRWWLDGANFPGHRAGASLKPINSRILTDSRRKTSPATAPGPH